MIPIPTEKIRVIGGTLRKDTVIYSLCCLDDDKPWLVIPRLTLKNVTMKGEAYLEVKPIHLDNFKHWPVNALEVFNALGEQSSSNSLRRDIVLDLLIAYLTRSIEFDLRRYPRIGIKLTIRKSLECSKTYRGLFEDCTIFTQLIPELFEI